MGTVIVRENEKPWRWRYRSCGRVPLLWSWNGSLSSVWSWRAWRWWLGEMVRLCPVVQWDSPRYPYVWALRCVSLVQPSDGCGKCFDEEVRPCPHIQYDLVAIWGWEFIND
jgi:hypothetical protein